MYAVAHFFAIYKTCDRGGQIFLASRKSEKWEADIDVGYLFIAN